MSTATEHSGNCGANISVNSLSRSEHSSPPWSYSFFYSGETISNETRLRYKATLISRKPGGNPFSLSNQSEF